MCPTLIKLSTQECWSKKQCFVLIINMKYCHGIYSETPYTAGTGSITVNLWSGLLERHAGSVEGPQLHSFAPL
jgi:hypothetical protein